MWKEFFSVRNNDLAALRFPSKTTICLKYGDLLENVKKDRSADVNIINTEADMTIEKMISIVNELRISAIFCADSEYE